VEVVILRHGKVNYPPIKMISARDFTKWVEAYNSNELDRSLQPTEEAFNIANRARAVVCSDLPRSIESAEYLGIKDITVIDSHFQEAGLPVGPWKYPKLSVRVWAIFFRLSWLFGYSNGSESLSEAKKRAKKSTEKLIQMAEEHKIVLFVGHGIINRLIAKELRRLGWSGPKVPSRKYWEYGIYKIET
jgi:broad specificity phosphatase PhoE